MQFSSSTDNWMFIPVQKTRRESFNNDLVWKEVPILARAAVSKESKWCLVVENIFNTVLIINDRRKTAAYHLYQKRTCNSWWSHQQSIPSVKCPLHWEFSGAYVAGSNDQTLICDPHETRVPSPLRPWSISPFLETIHTTFIFHAGVCRPFHWNYF